MLISYRLWDIIEQNGVIFTKNSRDIIMIISSTEKLFFLKKHREHQPTYQTWCPQRDLRSRGYIGSICRRHQASWTDLFNNMFRSTRAFQDEPFDWKFGFALTGIPQAEEAIQ